MPELPEVQTVLDGVAKVLQGARINGLECFYPGTVSYDPEALQPVFPATLTGHERRGKYMLLRLSSGNSLIIHLRMTGKLVSQANGSPTQTHERACILLSGAAKLSFVDIRTFGKIIVCRSENTGKFIPDLGIEPLSAEFTPRYLQNLLRGRKAPIKNALLDQSLIAGLGNIYACEILYRARVRPDAPSGSLSLAKLTRIAAQTKEVLIAAIANNGTSISDYRRVDDKTGQFQNFLQIYQKTTCPQGHPVQKLRQGGRGTFHCPVCQK